MHLPFETPTALPDVGVSIFARMTALAQRHGAINLAQGFPDFSPPERLQHCVTEAMQAGHHQYAPMPGVPALRQAIARQIQNLYGMEVDAEEEVTVTAGATYGLFAVFQALLQAGDEVIVFEPAYDSYVPGIRLAGATPVFVPLQFPDYSIDWNAVKNAVGKRTRALVMNTPHNPSGTCWTDADYLALQELTAGTQLLVISDEVYAPISFDGRRNDSVLRYPELANRSIVVSSFGKMYHNTGWKMGYIAASAVLTRAIRAVHQFILFSVNTPQQHALAAYMEAYPEHVQELSAFYQQKRDTFLQLIEGSRFSWKPASGTYFQLLDYSQISLKADLAFAEELTSQFGVAAIPLSPFYHSPENQQVLRFCFAKSEETLRKAADILCKI